MYINVNTLPVFPEISIFENCESSSSDVGDFYFYVKDGEILNGQYGKQVLYFETEQDAHLFLNSKEVAEYEASSFSHAHVLMHSIKAHGKWSKKEPFLSEAKYDKSRPIAVITRATIKPALAYKFWRYVPSVSKSAAAASSLASVST